MPPIPAKFIYDMANMDLHRRSKGLILVNNNDVEVYAIGQDRWKEMVFATMESKLVPDIECELNELPILCNRGIMIRKNDRLAILDNGPYCIFDKRSGRAYRIFILASPLGNCIKDYANIVFFLQSRYIHSQGETMLPSPQDLTSSYAMMHCGGIARSLVNQLSTIGVKARVVKGWCATNPNGYDDGHTCIEFCDPNGRWHFFESSYGLIPTFEGKTITVLELAMIAKRRLGINENIGFIRSPFCKPLPSAFNADKIFLDQKNSYIELKSHANNESMVNCPEKMIRWYEHVFQVPVIDNAFCIDYIEHDSRKDMNIIKRFVGRRPLTEAEFVNEFYQSLPT